MRVPNLGSRAGLRVLGLGFFQVLSVEMRV